MTQDIKKEISKRRNYNKQKRGNPQNEELENLYMEQKNKVKMIVKSVICQHEKKITEEIRSEGNKTKKLWNHIKKLKGESVKNVRHLHNNEGFILKEEDQKIQIENFCSTIYKQNKINEVWNRETRQMYEDDLEASERTHREYIQIMITNEGIWQDLHTPQHQREHIDMAYQCRKHGKLPFLLQETLDDWPPPVSSAG